MSVAARVDLSTLPPRELAKALLRHDSSRSMITDHAIPILEVVKAIRRGGAGMGGGYPGGFSAQVHGLHVEVWRSQGEQHHPPIRFTTYDLVSEMRAEASAMRQPSLWEGASV